MALEQGGARGAAEPPQIFVQGGGHVSALPPVPAPLGLSLRCIFCPVPQTLEQINQHGFRINGSTENKFVTSKPTNRCSHLGLLQCLLQCHPRPDALVVVDHIILTTTYANSGPQRLRTFQHVTSLLWSPTERSTWPRTICNLHSRTRTHARTHARTNSPPLQMSAITSVTKCQ